MIQTLIQMMNKDINDRLKADSINADDVTTSAPLAANPMLPAVFLSGKHKQEQFHKDLKSLLKKYDAEIAIEDFGHDYSVNEKIVVDFNWDEDLSNRINDGIVICVGRDRRPSFPRHTLYNLSTRE